MVDFHWKQAGPIDTSSPDAVVKSWWKHMGFDDAFAAKRCIAAYAAINNRRIYPELAAIMTPEMLDRFLVPDADKCEFPVLERTIDEVKSESETRASVFATVRQISPVPSKFYDAQAEAEFKAGTKLKYVTEKIDGKWRIADAFHRDRWAKDWTQYFERRSDSGFMALYLQY